MLLSCPWTWSRWWLEGSWALAGGLRSNTFFGLFSGARKKRHQPARTLSRSCRAPWWLWGPRVLVTVLEQFSCESGSWWGCCSSAQQMGREAPGETQLPKVGLALIRYPAVFLQRDWTEASHMALTLSQPGNDGGVWSHHHSTPQGYESACYPLGVTGPSLGLCRVWPQASPLTIMESQGLHQWNGWMSASTLLGRGKEGRIWWEHFVMVDFNVIHNNNNSECPCIFGKNVITPANEEPSRIMVISKEKAHSALFAPPPFIVSGCDSSSLAVSITREFLSTPSLPAPSLPPHAEIVMCFPCKKIWKTHSSQTER